MARARRSNLSESSRVPRKSASSSAPGATSAASAVDTRKGYDDYGKLIAAVRVYCLGEYERLWGRPWDNTWPELHQHIVNMRDTAKRARAVWSKLQQAVEKAVAFVESQGLPADEEPNFVIREGEDLAFPLDGKTVYETFVIHDWLHNHQDAVEALLNEDFGKMHALRSDLAELLGRTLLEEPAQLADTIQWNAGGAKGRELTEREMAYVSLLVGNEPPSLKQRLKDEQLSVEDIIEIEREAINTARVRHDEVKKKELAERAGRGAPGGRRAKSGPPDLS